MAKEVNKTYEEIRSWFHPKGDNQCAEIFKDTEVGVLAGVSWDRR
jgi:hypothetical protein